ncbi:unnamed protein product, partial [marine sediment metagenome]
EENKEAKKESSLREYTKSEELKEEQKPEEIGKSLSKLFKRYYGSRKLKAEWRYKNNRLEGISKSYYESGKLKGEENYKNGRLEDIAREYYPGGKLKAERNYKANRLSGITRRYYEGGQLWIKWNYKGGKRSGITKEYYSNGRRKAEANFKNDKLEGITRIYSKKGEIAAINSYRKGYKINAKKYNEIGKLVLDQNYPYEPTLTDERIARGLSGTLRMAFVKTKKFRVLRRIRMTGILRAQAFRLTGCATAECAVKIGKLLNVDYMAIG